MISLRTRQPVERVSAAPDGLQAHVGHEAGMVVASSSARELKRLSRNRAAQRLARWAMDCF